MNKIAKELSSILGKEKVYSDELSLKLYSRNAVYMEGSTDAVVFPESIEDIRKVVKYAFKNNIKIYPQGSSSELVGSSIPSSGSIVLNFSRMNRIIEVSLLDSYVIVEPGLRLVELNNYLELSGFFFPVDPASYKTATVGGAVNSGSGGLMGAKYGNMKDWVLGLDVILPDKDATLLHLGSKTLKNREGYDLVRLIIGSEGTLAIIARATLKIIPKPKYVAIVAGFFKSFESLLETVSKIKESGYDVLLMEFVDEYTARTTAKALGIDLEVYGHMLITGIISCRESVERILSEIMSIYKERGGMKLYTAKTLEEAEEKGIFDIRRGYHPAAIKKAAEERKDYSSKPVVYTEDISIPPSRLAEAVREIRELGEKYGVEVSIAGHISDGNIHPLIWGETGVSDFEKLHDFFMDIMRIAMKYDGVVSSEHGIGLLKKDILKEAFRKRNSLKAIDIMREIKRIFDPKNILNPNKIFDL